MRKLILVLVCLLVFGLPTAGQAARVWWVDDDGPADFHNIQDAIDNSSDGDTIIVKPGIYSYIFFNGKAVTVTSQNPNDPNTVQSTIITAGSGYSVTFDFLEGNSSIITGFTITGRGIHCYGASPTISKNIIKNCADNGIHGDGNAAPVISDNTIKSNAWMGIYSCNGPITGNTISGNGCGIASCNSPITNNIISNNYNTIPGFGLGGGLYNCHGNITGNTIANNYASYRGGGLYGCNGDISNNTITGNRANSEGGGLFNCQGNIGNNIIAGNVGYHGGGLCNCGGLTYNIYNNTITGNRADYGGAIYNCSGFVRNNILAFNQATEVGGIYGPCDNSYNAFWNNQGGNFGGGGVPSPKDVVIDPRFAVNGQWDSHGTGDPSDDTWNDGDYHLKSQAGRWDPNSQLWVKDAATSQCIDAGDPNSVWTAELWPHGKRINLGAYGGTPEASMSLSGVGNVADIDNDGLVDFNDMALLTEMWLSDQILLAEDLNRDRIVNLADFAILAANWRPGAPAPNPMTWATPPYATSPYSIAMVATTATSTDWSGVEYYFEDFEHPQFNSGWISFAPGQQPRWENTGLTPDTEYWYRVKARNKLNLLETSWSELASATTLPEDTTPPTPDPMTWATEPYATSSTSIRMVAATASDDSGVQYYFQCTSDANYNSSWQDSPIYEATSLKPALYTFVARARDKSPNYNTTSNSTPATVDLKPPTPSPMLWASGGEPKKVDRGGSFNWWAVMTAAEATDESGGIQYFFECTNNSGFSSNWQSNRYYEVQLGGQSVPARFKVKARDAHGNETGWSSELPANP
jgi:parallel beta-helix repeat protein